MKQSVIYYFSDKEKTSKRFFVQCTGQNIVTSHNILDALAGNILMCNSICNLLNMSDTNNKWFVWS